MASRIVLAAAAAAMLTSCGERWSKECIAETTRRGDIVSQAINAYHNKAGKYPFQLSELRPDFLREIPQPTAGAK